MAELINEKDSLNTGRKKLNEAIKDSNQSKQESSEALNKANQSIHQSQSTQEQLNQIIINGDSSVEAAAARVDEENVTHDTLKDRIDDGFTKAKTQLAEKANKVEFNQLDLKKADKIYVDDLFENLGQLEIKGSYNSVSALTNAYPNGTEGLFEVEGNLYAWNGSEWKSVFALEITPWADFLTTENEDWSVA